LRNTSYLVVVVDDDVEVIEEDEFEGLRNTSYLVVVVDDDVEAIEEDEFEGELDVDRLVYNLFMVWVGRHKLQANIPRFQREPLKRHSFLHNIDGVKRGNSGYTYNSNGVKGAANSYAHIVKGSQNSKKDSDSSPVMSSQIHLASSDFNTDGRVTWVETKGIPLKMWSKNTFNRVASKYGVLLDVDDQEDEHFHRKQIFKRVKKIRLDKKSLKYPPGYTPTGSKEAIGEKQFDTKKIQRMMLRNPFVQ
nr:UvrD-like helicase, ATP-binding domain, P-loop containing nucleoside triphosphate hydrolase [Tanacetum cinerariifolium]